MDFTFYTLDFAKYSPGPFWWWSSRILLFSQCITWITWISRFPFFGRPDFGYMIYFILQVLFRHSFQLVLLRREARASANRHRVSRLGMCRQRYSCLRDITLARLWFGKTASVQVSTAWALIPVQWWPWVTGLVKAGQLDSIETHTRWLSITEADNQSSFHQARVECR